MCPAHLSPAERFLYEVNCAFKRKDHEIKSPVFLFLNLLRGFYADGCSLLMLNIKDLNANYQTGGNLEMLAWLTREVSKEGFRYQGDFSIMGCLPEERLTLICRGISYPDIESHDIRPVLFIWRKQRVFDIHDLVMLEAAISLLKTRLSDFALTSGQAVGDPLGFSAEYSITCGEDSCRLCRTSKSVLDSIQDYVLAGDQHGALIWINKKAQESFGQHLSEAERKNFSWLPQFLHLDDVDGVMQNMTKALQNKSSSEFPARFLIDETSLHRLSCHLSMLSNNCWVLICRPEEPTYKSLDSEKSYIERLVQEMRIPVAFSLANLVKLREKVPSKHLREQVDMIHNSIVQVNSNLIDALLITDRSGDLFTLEMDTLSPEETLDNVLKAKATVIENMKADVLIDVGKTLPKLITADKWKFQQALERLIAHILSRIHQGTALTGTLRKALDSTGMNVELQLMFTQANSSSTAGCGPQSCLDLAVLKKLVSMMRGSFSEKEDYPVKVFLRISLPYKEARATEAEDNLSRTRAAIADDLDKFIKSLGRGSQIDVVLHGVDKCFVEHIHELLGDISGLRIHCVQAGEAVQPQGMGCRTIIITESLNNDVASWVRSRDNLTKGNARIIALRPSLEDFAPDTREISTVALSTPYTDHGLLRTLQEAIIRLSISLPKVSEVHPTPPASPSFDSEFANKYPMFVMVAEDNLLNLQVLVKTLNRLGYLDVVTASDGQQAVEKFHEQIQKSCPVEIIFMDMQMPFLDGCGASLEIRQLMQSAAKGKGHGPHIVAMTANSFQEDRQSCLRSGMCRFATKPVNWEYLVQLLKEGYDSLKGTRLCRCQYPSASSW